MPVGLNIASAGKCGNNSSGGILDSNNVPFVNGVKTSQVGFGRNREVPLNTQYLESRTIITKTNKDLNVQIAGHQSIQGRPRMMGHIDTKFLNDYD